MEVPKLERPSWKEIIFRTLGVGLSFLGVASVLFGYWLPSEFILCACAAQIAIGLPCTVIWAVMESDRETRVQTAITKYVCHKNDEAQTNCQPLNSVAHEAVKKRVKNV